MKYILLNETSILFKSSLKIFFLEKLFRKFCFCNFKNNNKYFQKLLKDNLNVFLKACQQNFQLAQSNLFDIIDLEDLNKCNTNTNNNINNINKDLNDSTDETTNQSNTQSKEIE